MLVKLVAVIFFTPIFILPGILLTALGYVCGQIYIKAQLSIRREMSVARAPILSHFNATMAGIGGCNTHNGGALFLCVNIKCQFLSEPMARKRHSMKSRFIELIDSRVVRGFSMMSIGKTKHS